MVEKDSMNLVTVAEKSKPSQYCDTIFSLKLILKELNFLCLMSSSISFQNLVPRNSNFFLICSFGNARQKIVQLSNFPCLMREY